ncbi:hypothetical protein R1sor_019186 [Riccia sorocarpa]|uniref:Uncharacterized protein n=1 Tax=Riccia sorocarpa TaxID=122646 RepID=A0ABD3II05_9MARC
MLRTSARSVGSTYRRLWEKSVINALRSSSSSSTCHRGGRDETRFEDLPTRRFYSAQSSEITSSSIRQDNSKNVFSKLDDEDHSKTERVITGPRPSSSVVIHPGLPTSFASSTVTTVREVTPKLDSSTFQQRLLKSCYFKDRTGSRSHHGRLDQAVRLIATEAGSAEAAHGEKSSGESSGPGAKKSPPRSLDDFQHEEIVGPTVERDLSALAEEVRSSLTELRYYMGGFRTGFVILGAVLLVTTLWGALISKTAWWIWRDLPLALMSFIFAYLLRYAESTMEFFSKMEGRSRLRILTLALQVLKGLSQFFQRSGVAVKVAAFTSFVALIKQAFPSS